MANLVLVRRRCSGRGKAGEAWWGVSSSGTVRQGEAGMFRLGEVGCGAFSPGKARQARRDEAGRGLARCDKARQAGFGGMRLAEVWQGLARQA